ncbi:MAG: NAD(+) synthase [Halanaerobiales bacterium]|nr:NAD(+) synthase [Halanaerobiales bacterium]MCF8009056.1 NAD(+) synthase [Halanaerobiales bacterium]
MNLDYDHVQKVLVEWLKGKVTEANLEGVVVGLSGGIDSAVTAVLAKKAFNNDTLALILPCYSDNQDQKDAIKVAEKFNIKYKTVKLNLVYDSFKKVLDINSDHNKLALANIKPRLRMTTLYYYAQLNNYLVLGTDNWSELKVGYFTKYGDGGIDLTILGRLVKTEVRELAKHLNIPEPIINKKPSAGLWQGQTDEDELGISYEQLDKYILTGQAVPKIKKKIEAISQKNSHKLEPIPVPKREILLS